MEEISVTRAQITKSRPTKRPNKDIPSGQQFHKPTVLLLGWSVLPFCKSHHIPVSRKLCYYFCFSPRTTWRLFRFITPLISVITSRKEMPVDGCCCWWLPSQVVRCVNWSESLPLPGAENWQSLQHFRLVTTFLLLSSQFDTQFVQSHEGEQPRDTLWTWTTFNYVLLARCRNTRRIHCHYEHISIL